MACQNLTWADNVIIMQNLQFIVKQLGPKLVYTIIVQKANTQWEQ